MKKVLFFYFLTLLSCSKKTSVVEDSTNLFYDKAFEYKDKNKIDSSFLYFYKAKDLFLQSKDSSGAGKCIINMAIILTDKNDYYGGQETSLEAIKFFKEESEESKYYLASNYNNLGIATSKLKDYPNAIKFYTKAIEFTNDSINKNIYKNNLANSYRKEKKYSSAINVFQNILTISQNRDKEYARTLSNIAYTKWLQNDRYNPLPEFKEALIIREKEKDLWGQNASFSHLTDYYNENQLDSALFYARKMYNVSKEIKSPDDQIEALQKLINLENSENSKEYFNVFKNLNDSLQTARNKAKNQFALIRYETEKNKADFLEAKADSSQKQNHIIKQYFGLAFLSLVLIWGYFSYKKRKKRLEQEKILEVKNTELKYSKRVHDKVANKIYQVMSQVENVKDIDRNALLFGLENAYEISRDISYDNDINENQNFVQQLFQMLNSYSSDSVKTIFTGNNKSLWEGVNFQSKTEVYVILQELMTNMRKHSKARIVAIKFNKIGDDINITYADNGIGIQELSPKNGIQNMENRIRAIDGKITFDTETKHLLKIKISFPVKK